MLANFAMTVTDEFDGELQDQMNSTVNCMFREVSPGARIKAKVLRTVFVLTFLLDDHRGRFKFVVPRV